FNAVDPTGNKYSAFGDGIYKANSSGGGVATFSGSKGNGSAVNVRYDGILVYSDGTVRRADYNNDTGNVAYGPGHAVKIAWNNTQSLFVYHNNNDIFTVTMGGIVNQVTSTAGTEEITPALSPNETKVIFVSNKEGNKDIFMANINGSNLVNLTNTPGVDETLPDWSN
ncbi:MAG: TolB family protein, partial [Candidatus Sericytochromatia bacterium]